MKNRELIFIFIGVAASIIGLLITEYFFGELNKPVLKTFFQLSVSFIFIGVFYFVWAIVISIKKIFSSEKIIITDDFRIKTIKKYNSKTTYYPLVYIKTNSGSSYWTGLVNTRHRLMPITKKSPFDDTIDGCGTSDLNGAYTLITQFKADQKKREEKERQKELKKEVTVTYIEYIDKDTEQQTDEKIEAEK